MSPPFSQLDAAGRLRHLVTLDGLPRSLLEDLLVRAEALAARPARNEALRGFTVANLFGEPSTRTRASFELAALRQGADVVNLDNTLSSRAKGETLLDTAYTLLAMRVDIFVIRDAEPGVQEQVARAVDGQASVVSAGEANVSHPTQGLLDALTIRQCKGDFGGTLGGDRRRHRPLARRALGAPRARDARRAGHPHRRAARDDAGRRRVRRQPPLPVAGRGHRGRRRRDDAAHPARARRRRAGGCRGLSPRLRADGRAPRPRGAAKRSSCIPAR